MLQIPQDIVLKFGMKPYILMDELQEVNNKLGALRKAIEIAEKI